MRESCQTFSNICNACQCHFQDLHALGTTVAHVCETDSGCEQSKRAFPRSHDILLQGFILCGHAQSPPARGPNTCSLTPWNSTSQGLHQTGPFSLVWIQLKCFIHEGPVLWTLNPTQHSHSTLLQSLCDSACPAVSLALTTIWHCIIYWLYSLASVFFVRAETCYLQ